MKFDINKLKKGKFSSKLEELSANELTKVLGGDQPAGSCSVTSSSTGCESTTVCSCTPPPLDFTPG